MGAIMNGIALHGGTRVFGGTFLTFSDYMRGAVRLAALMQLPVTYVWTHDSIGLGEDGPTHQPIEHLAALRAIPGLDVVRPADANETAAVWQARSWSTPTVRPALALTRQNVPVFPRGDATATASSGRACTAGRLRPGRRRRSGPPDVVLVGTGSEVQLAVEARELLAADGIRARVVSMPCREWFDEQDQAYRESVLPPDRQGPGLGRGRRGAWAGARSSATHGRIVSIDHYGASADYARIYEEFGITARGRRQRRRATASGWPPTSGPRRVPPTGTHIDTSEEAHERPSEGPRRRRRLHLARRPVARADRDRQPRRAGQGEVRRRRDHQPDDLRRRHRRRRALRRAGPRARRARASPSTG